MLPKVLIGLLVVHVPVRVLVLLVRLPVPLPVLSGIESLVKAERVRDGRDLRMSASE